MIYSAFLLRTPNFPVNYVTWGDAARFCNWLQNGQPALPEGAGTTETGSYTLNGAITDASLMTVNRNAEATWCIPTENEWYKAAYYDPNKNGVGNAGYWPYPTRSNTAPDNTLSNAATDPNDANYYVNGYTDPTKYLTAVGTFASSPSAYGTYDQGGDVSQWNEAIIYGSERGMRGVSYYGYFVGSMLSSARPSYDPTVESPDFGFRVSQVPEPASLGVLGIGVIGMLVRRRGGRR